MGGLSDADIISSARPPSAALGPLFERHFDAVYRYLDRRVGPQLAEELAADTFVQALTHLSSYDRARPDARPWLFGIATNLLRHHARSEHRRLIAYRRAAVEQASSPVIPDDLGAALIAPAFIEVIRRMPSEQRDVLLLHAWADLSYEEIAEALQIPIGTVRSRLSRAKQSLRELLERERATTRRSGAEGDDDER
jgi:RNA polymerase sigma factor (sigma-70 family)